MVAVEKNDKIMKIISRRILIFFHHYFVYALIIQAHATLPNSIIF